MASFKDYLTIEGQRLLTRAASGQKIKFTKIVMGEGDIGTGSEVNMTDVIMPVKEIALDSVVMNSSNSILITATFHNTNLEAGFYFREKGVYASDGTKDILVLYGNNRDAAEYIDTAEVCVIEKGLRTVLMLSSQEIANVTLENNNYGPAPVVKPELAKLEDFTVTAEAETMQPGQLLILNNSQVYTFLGTDPADAANYSSGENTVSTVYDSDVTDGDTIAASQSALHEVYELTQANKEALGKKANAEEVNKSFNEVNQKIQELTPKELTATLSSGYTELSFTDDSISDAATYEFYTDTLGLSANSVDISGDTLTLTFEAQDEDVEVTVVVKESE